MPLRGLQKMTGGAFSMGMVDALVMEVKGFWIIGIVRFLVELIKNLIRNANMSKRLNR
jgi:beta-glucosidase